MRVLNDLMLETTAVALSQNSNAQALDHIFAYDILAKITAANPGNLAFTAAASDVLTTAANDYATGMKFTITTTGTEPAGLAVLTDYYWIRVSSTTGKAAASQADALAGTAVDVTDAGTGTHTIVPTATIAGSIKLQKCNDPESVPEADRTWFDITSSSQNFTATSNLNWTGVDVGYRLLRAVATVTSGTVTAAIRINGKGG